MRLSGKHLVVTSGPTLEAIDPVRFISNRSSGKQGHAIAAEFIKLGARVTLVSGPVSVPTPDGVDLVRVETTDEMLAAVLSALPCDAAVLCAAVADFKPREVSPHKFKKRDSDDQMTITFVKTPDILSTLRNHARRPTMVVGFAAETDNVIENAKAKLIKKNADMILANDVANGAVFNADTTHLYCVTASGSQDWGAMTKQNAAAKIAASVSEFLETNTNRKLAS